ncbi:MAG: hypothetical protein K6F50_05050 [Kiritimatiellae bacterium]|nr:hypothetical protein [Kiritimatiellia bacterium]
MTKTLACLTAIASAAFLLHGCGGATGTSLAGVYSNGYGGLGASSVILSPDGYGEFSAGQGGAQGAWSVLKCGDTEFVHMRLAEEANGGLVEADALFELDRKNMTLDYSSMAKSLNEAVSIAMSLPPDRPENPQFHYTLITNEVPAEVAKSLADFPSNFAEAKRRSTQRQETPVVE